MQMQMQMQMSSKGNEFKEPSLTKEQSQFHIALKPLTVCLEAITNSVRALSLARWSPVQLVHSIQPRVRYALRYWRMRIILYNIKY